MTFGSCTAPVREALARARRDGIKARLVSMRLLSPAQPERLAKALAGVKRVLVVEQNHGGQFHRYLRADFDLPGEVRSLRRPGPLPIRARRGLPATHRMEPLMSSAAASSPLTAQAFKSAYKPIWCPGCGDYSVLSSITKAFAMLGRSRKTSPSFPESAAPRASPPIRTATAFTACTAARSPRAPV